MILKSYEAHQMECPLSFGGPQRVKCASKLCPMWRWEKGPVLHCCTYLIPEARKEFEKAHGEGATFPPKVENFITPKGQGWKSRGKAIWTDKVDPAEPATWVQRWERLEDQEARGFCGIGGVPEGRGLDLWHERFHDQLEQDG